MLCLSFCLGAVSCCAVSKQRSFVRSCVSFVFSLCLVRVSFVFCLCFVCVSFVFGLVCVWFVFGLCLARCGNACMHASAWINANVCIMCVSVHMNANVCISPYECKFE